MRDEPMQFEGVRRRHAALRRLVQVVQLEEAGISALGKMNFGWAVLRVVEGQCGLDRPPAEVGALPLLAIDGWSG